MTVEQIKEKIEQIKGRLFMMNMIDRWTLEDEKRVNAMENELHELELKLA